MLGDSVKTPSTQSTLMKKTKIYHYVFYLLQASDDLVIRYPIDYDENDLLGRKGTERLQTSRIRLTYHLSPRPSRFLEAAATVTSANLGRNDIVSGLQERLRTGDVTMRLKCTAKIGNGYWKSTEKSTRLRHRERLLESRSASASNG